MGGFVAIVAAALVTIQGVAFVDAVAEFAIATTLVESAVAFALGVAALGAIGAIIVCATIVVYEIYANT